jgi:uncharacterized protein
MKKLIAGSVFAGVMSVVMAMASPAFAHVSVSSSPEATQGGYATITFKVPTESDTASTTKLTITFPTDAPIASVAVQPKPGWSYVTTDQTLAKPLTDDDGNQVTKAVGTITWTAQAGAAIKPGEFDTFNISAGPLPEVASLGFAAQQTYSDGKVVNWNQVAAAGTAEPDFPKPTLTLAKAADSSGQGSSTSSDSSSKSSNNNTAALVIAIIALVLAAGALGLVVVTRAKSNQAKSE